EQGVEVASHPDIADAPGASFSVATKPQDRDPSLLRQAQEERTVKAIEHGHGYELDQNGRVPANNYNYLQRDRLVAEAQRSALLSGNHNWVVLMDLAHLASQHHLSPYSVMKFGPRGSPFAYIPITLQQPQAVDQTMRRQQEQETHAIQWLLRKRSRPIHTSAPGEEPEDLPVLRLPSDAMHRSSPVVGSKRPASVTTPPDGGSRARTVLRVKSDSHEHGDTEAQARQVEHELSEAMSQHIQHGRLPSGHAPLHGDSSSEEVSRASSQDDDDVDLGRFDRSTRMIEIRDPSSGASEASSQAAVDDAGSTLATTDETRKAENKNVPDAELTTDPHSGSNVELGGPMDTERVMSQEMEQAEAIEQPGRIDGSNGEPSQHPSSQQQAQHQQQSQQAHLAMKTSDTHPIHISPILPEHLLDEISMHVQTTMPAQMRQLCHGATSTPKLANGNNGIHTTGNGHGGANGPSSVTHSYMDADSHAEAQIKGGRLIRLRNALDLTSITSTDPSAAYLSQSQLAEQASREAALSLRASGDSLQGPMSRGPAAVPLIGNLLLSSCPGKKVRLSGPVRGRGAICRDLGLDLKRIHGIGVRAVICCLDDDELSYLGAPWAEYEREADMLGLEVIRLPMAEGFAPTDVREMDTAITSVVTDYTLRGTNVLVHCRGGVGRAGLIACAWMLKMGFVGSPSHVHLHHQQQHYGSTSNGNVRSSNGGPPKEIANGVESHHRDNSVANGTDHGHVNGSGNGNGQQLSSSSSAGKNQSQNQNPDLTDAMEDDESTTIIETVRSLIETIRRRRSPKAIETAEQVRFLVEYTTFLHRQERM
ncbi:hypothetical protein BCV70DRAFT_140106, partial [Testicularia cyperi]